MRRSLSSSGVLHGLTTEQADAIAARAAKLTAEGWVVPGWAHELQRTVDQTGNTQEDAASTKES